MTPVIPLADPLPLPAPAGLLWALLQLTFLLHLVAMNVVLGGTILALHWRFSRRAEGAPQRAALLAFFAKALPVAVAATVTLGVAPLLFVQVLYGRLFFTSSILMAWFWLAIVPLVILAYYGAYLLAFRGEALGGRARVVAGIVMLLFAVVAFLQVSNATRSIRPDTFVDAYRASGRGLTLNPRRPDPLAALPARPPRGGGGRRPRRRPLRRPPAPARPGARGLGDPPRHDGVRRRDGGERLRRDAVPARPAPDRSSSASWAATRGR